MARQITINDSLTVNPSNYTAKLYVKENGIWTEQLFSYIEDEEISHIK